MHRIACIALTAVFALAGCDATVEPGPRTERPYTLYGFLDPSATSQKIRVIEIDAVLTPETADPLDLTLTSTDLASGSTLTWRDSVVTFAGGAVGHVYTAPFRPDYGTAYRIDAVRSDGVSSTAEVRIPLRATLTEGDAPVDTIRTVVKTAANTDTTIITYKVKPNITFDLSGEVPRLLDVRMRYTVELPSRLIEETEVEVPYFLGETGSYVEQVAGGWVIQTNLNADHAAVRRELAKINSSVRFDDDVTFYEATLEFFVVHEEWVSPIGVFDPEALIEPGTFSNVDNGFGFIGAGYSIERKLAAPDSVFAAAAFRVLE